MKFDVLTLFPEMFETMKQSVIGRAIQKNLLEINLVNKIGRASCRERV